MAKLQSTKVTLLPSPPLPMATFAQLPPPDCHAQAGGGESGLSDSLLETPTYVLSIVFLLFLVRQTGGSCVR